MKTESTVDPAMIPNCIIAQAQSPVRAIKALDTIEPSDRFKCALARQW
jgi:hypothetical protein